MTIDNSWITIRDRRSPVFLQGLKDFIERAKNYVDSEGKTKCPCKKCVNVMSQDLDHVFNHIHDYGFLQVYKVWIHHGEQPVYVRNKAKPEGSIAEGYVADEALTFCSMYLDGMHTKFNRPDRNADDGIPKMKYSVFSSQCRPLSKKHIISITEQSKKSFHWFVLNNCEQIKEYISEFQHESPQSEAKQEFPSWFNKKFNTSTDNELMSLAYGPTGCVCSYTACTVNGVRFVVHGRDVRRTTQNSGVVSVGEDGTRFYGQLEDILEVKFIKDCSVVLFRCKWFDTTRKGAIIKKNNIVAIDTSRTSWEDEPYILATQAQQVFYLVDPSKTTSNWRVVEDVHHRRLWDHPSIKVTNDIDVLHDNESSDYNLVVDDGCEAGETSAQADEVDHEVVPPSFSLVVDLGSLPMASTSGEGFINDDEEDEDAHPSDEEDDIGDDKDESDAEDDIVEDGYYSSDGLD